MVEVKAADLTGPVLTWALEQIEGAMPEPLGQLQLPFCPLSLDDETCERLIARYGVWVERGAHVPWVSSISLDPFDRQSGETRAEATVRAIVASIFGGIVRVPKELINAN